MKRRRLIVLRATHWGRRAGGINGFNYDFGRALAAVLEPSHKVVCVVDDATLEEVRDAQSAGVMLICPGKSRSRGNKADDEAIVAEVVRRGIPCAWVGHDVITGLAAANCADITPAATLALLHHMNYFDYQAFKSLDGSYAAAKAEQQHALFTRGDVLFAIGPLLRDSLARDLDICVEGIPMLIPGLDGIEPSIRRAPRLTVIAFGRLDVENDRIKQGRLAVAGFALACKRAENNLALPDLMHPTLVLMGVDQETRLRHELHELMERYGAGARNLFVLPFMEDRKQLLVQLRRASVALFLSWYDGFGLAAWEAIAAGVPLVLSRNTGAHQLIRELLGGPGLGCIHTVMIGGRARGSFKKDYVGFTAADVETVAQALLEHSARAQSRHRDALTLRSLLLEKGCTWERCARAFAGALDLPCRKVLHRPRSH